MMGIRVKELPGVLGRKNAFRLYLVAGKI